MYLCITSKCNMHCPHCAMDATENGEHMLLETFYAALRHHDYLYNICLGGGESTLHPHFEEMLLHSISYGGRVVVITNGSQHTRSLLLARLARQGIVTSVLSLDKYHETISSEVIDAFNTPNPIPRSIKIARKRDCRDIAKLEHIIKEGRAKNNIPNAVEDCIASGEPFVRVNGNVYLCGCSDSLLLGDVFGGFKSPPHWVCHKRLSLRKEKANNATAVK